MKILIITSIVGKNAAGIVFDSIISELSNDYQIQVITKLNQSKNLSNTKNTKVIQVFNHSSWFIQLLIKLKVLVNDNFIIIHPSLSKFLIGIIGFNPFDYLWFFKIKKYINRSQIEFNVVFSLGYYHEYSSVFAGKKVASIKNAKWAVYFVDAIPPPLGWSKDGFYFRGCKRLVKNCLKGVDIFFAPNSKMLKYQLSLFKNKKDLLADVIYTPTSEARVGKKELEEKIFLYTGSIYGPRKLVYLFKAFKKLINNYHDVKLVFVGTKISKSELLLFSMEELKSIEIYQFANNLEIFYERAIALLDIDADLDNDVFLSSKIANYLQINCPIICETGLNSPSRNLFRNIPSIIQCNHNHEELYDAMVSVLLNEFKGIEDRQKIIDDFSAKKVSKKIIKNFNKVLEKEI